MPSKRRIRMDARAARNIGVAEDLPYRSVQTVDMLIAIGRLRRDRADDKRAVTAAIAKVFDELVTEFDRGTRSDDLLKELLEIERLGKRSR